MTATGQKQMGFQETNHLTKHRSVGPFRKRGRPGPPSTRVCQDHGRIGPNASSPRGGRENLQHIVLLSGRVTESRAALKGVDLLVSERDSDSASVSAESTF